MQDVLELIAANTGIPPTTQVKIAGTFAAAGAAVLVRGFLLRIFNRQIKNIRYRFVARKTATYLAFTFLMVVLGNLWFHGLAGMETYLGLLSAGVAIALKDPLTNLAAWLFLIARKPFGIGDRIEIASVRGDVIDIRVFQFLLLEIGTRIDAEQSTGRIVFVPNGQVFSHPLVNYTAGFPHIWNEIAVLVTFESNWKRAKAILKGIVEEVAGPLREQAERSIRNASKAFLIAYNQLEPAVYTAVKDAGVLLTMRYLCESRHRRESEHRIWEMVLEAFGREENIDLAYPTVRYYTPPPTPDEED